MAERVDVALVLVQDDQRRHVLASLPLDATAADLAAAIGTDAQLLRFETALEPGATLAATGLLSGDTIGVGGPVVVDWRQLGHQLRVIGGVGAGVQRRLDGRGLVIGRGEGADVVVNDRSLSRAHVEVSLEESGFAVRDLGSRNGVFVEGARVEADTRETVPFGNAVRVANTVFTVAAAENSGATLRRSDAFHLAFTAGRASRRPESPAPPPSDSASPSYAPPRSLLPFVVPSAGALALAAAAAGASPTVAFAATPVALLAAFAAERVVHKRQRHRVARAHEDASETAAEGLRASLLAYAQAARLFHPDPATLRAMVEQRRGRLWSASAEDLSLRLGLVADADGVLVPYAVAIGRAPLVLAGPEPSLDRMLAWMVLQAAALVPPRDLDVVVVSDDDAWAWTAWLPHRSDLTLLPADATPLQLPKRRALRRLIVLDRPRSSRWAGDPAVSSDDLLLWRSAHEHDVPFNAAAVVSAAADARLRVEDEHGVRDDVIADVVYDTDDFTTGCALALARLQSPVGAVADPRRAVAITDVVPSLRNPDAVLAAWRNPSTALRVLLGVDEAGLLDVALEGQNSHALIAGTTGSGKTRLLETLVLALAADRSPSRLNVLIIDFKGGNELAALAALPHCVGIVSDRDADEVDRAISALTREIARRDELFAQARASDLDAYVRTTGLRLPRLVVIADEFGQFRRDDAVGARVATLLRIASQGRSKGLHLVMATQSPSTDVTAEIRQNVGLRLCLRVAEASESVAVLGVPDATRLPGPGHVIVSHDNERRAGRVATARVDVALAATDIDIVDIVDAARNGVANNEGMGSALLDTVIDNVRRAAEATGDVAPVLLPPALPESVERRSLPHAGRPWTIGGLVIGQRDRPGIAEPPPFCFDPARDVALTVVGGSRSGRTTTLLALAEAALDQAADQPLEVHAIAWSPGLEQLDADAGVVHRGDYDHLRRMIAWLADPPDDGTTRLVLVDRIDVLLRDVREFDNGGFATQLLDALNGGPRRRVATVVTTDPGALVTGSGAVPGGRLVLPVDDATVAVAAGLPRRTLSAPGRAIAPNGDDVQIGAPQPGSATGVASTVARMPTAVSAQSLIRSEGERVTIGIGGHTRLAPLVVDLDDVGPVIVVIGRRGSGRSVALDAFGSAYAGARTVVRVDETVAAWSPAGTPSLLLVDDAVRTAQANPWLNDEELPNVLRQGRHVAVVAFEQSDLTGLGYRHWLSRRTYPGLLLSLDATPDRIVAGERLGFMPPTELRIGPVGRGWWCARGSGVPVQVAAN